MPDQYREVLIGSIFAICMFLVLAGIIIFFLFRYQKKRFEYQNGMIQLRQEFDQEILKASLEIQEVTFENISQEIHDNVGQLLSLAKVQLNIMDQSEVMDKEMLAAAKESLSNAMSDLRDIAKGLSGQRLQHLGLIPALQQETDRINRSRCVNVQLAIKGETGKLPEQKQLIIFRIVQEVLQNIIKHAEATNVQLFVISDITSFELSIHDDGKGFIVENVSQVGLGLENIVSRAKLIGGKAQITSDPGIGSEIKLTVPYE